MPTNAEQLANLGAAAVASFSSRNILHNGDFRIQQRGAVFTGVTEAKVVFDRWRATIGGAAGVNIIDGGPFSGVSRNSIRVGRASGTGAFGFYQSVERNDFERLKGRKVTFSGKLLKDPGLSGNIIAEIRTVTAEGGTVAVDTAATNIAAVSMAGVTDFSVTLDIPAGSAAQGLLVQLAASSQVGGATVGFYATALQLEVGGAATPYEWRPTEVEYAICQRFYEIGYWKTWGVATAAGQPVGETIQFKVTKRSPPVITLGNQAYANVTNGGIVTETNFHCFTAYDNSIAAGSASFSATFEAASDL